MYFVECVLRIVKCVEMDDVAGDTFKISEEIIRSHGYIRCAFDDHQL